MAARDTLKHQLRLALSKREKADALLSEARACDGPVELRRFYKVHIEEAESAIIRLREEARELELDAERRIMRIEEKQALLRERAAAGSGKPESLNREGRRLAREIRKASEALMRAKELLAAQNAAALGGLVDMPLERYLLPDAKIRIPWSATDALLSTGAFLCAALAMMAPWIIQNSKLIWAWRITGLTPGGPAMFAIICAGLALTASAFSVWRTRRPWAPWLLIGLSLAMLAAAAFPPARLLLSGQPGLDAFHVLHAIHAGPPLMALSALFYLALGSRMRDVIKGGASTQWRDAAAVLLTALIVAGITIGVFIAAPTFRSNDVSFSTRQQPDGSVSFVIRNSTSHPFMVLIPWPKNIPVLSQVNDKNHMAGFNAYLVRDGAEEPLETSSRAWMSKGHPCGGDVITIQSDTSMAFTFDPDGVEQGARPGDMIRVKASSMDGRELARAETTMPERQEPPASPGGQPLGAITPPQTPTPPTTTATQPPSQTSAPGEAPVLIAPLKPAAPSAAPKFLLILKSVRGERAVVEVVRPDGSARRFAASVGDEPLPGLIVESISTSPPSITFRRTDGLGESGVLTQDQPLKYTKNPAPSPAKE